MFKITLLYLKIRILQKSLLSWDWHAEVVRLGIFCLVFFGLGDVDASVQQRRPIFIGASEVDTTPSLPAALDGQMHVRIAEAVESPLTAQVVVVNSQKNDGSSNTSVWVTCDLVTIPTELLELIRLSVAKRLPDLDPEKIIVNATHTHTGGVVRNGWVSYS